MNSYPNEKLSDNLPTTSGMHQMVQGRLPIMNFIPRYFYTYSTNSYTPYILVFWKYTIYIHTYNLIYLDILARYHGKTPIIIGVPYPVVYEMPRPTPPKPSVSQNLQKSAIFASNTRFNKDTSQKFQI